MDRDELTDFLAAELDYPVDVETVRTTVGDAELDAPDPEDSLTVAEILAHVEDETYGSAEELTESVLANLPDEYVGRKYYSDRGGDTADDPTDAEDRSF